MPHKMKLDFNKKRGGYKSKRIINNTLNNNKRLMVVI